MTLLVIMLLPALIFTAYEINSLSDNEALIEQIYQQQLEAILFSVNQYCWDISNSWVNSTEMLYTGNQYKDLQVRYEGFLTKNRAINSIFLIDSSLSELDLFTASGVSHEEALSQFNIQETVLANADILNRLKKYKKVGYRKIESILVAENDEENDNQVRESILLLFAMTTTGSKIDHQFAGIVIDPNLFIHEVLSPKLEEVAGDRFYVAVTHGDATLSIHPAAQAHGGKEALLEFSQQKAFWLFPQFFLGISPQGTTIAEINRARFNRNMVLILLVDLFLICGVWYVYRNIRREMELAQLKSDFVSNISHELRTPLSLIRMFSETLEMGRVATEEKKQEYYKIIGQESERLTHLVNNILNFSRIEAGKKEFHFQEIDLNSVVTKVLDNYQFHLQNEGFQLQNEIQNEELPIQGDQEALSEAVINLLDNGMKYSEDEKLIRIKTGRENGSVFLEVEDKGIGIAEEDQAKIFEKFHRVSSGLVHNTKGSGLGLTLVKHIVEAHGGAIKIDSHPGRGSRFRVLFN